MSGGSQHNPNGRQSQLAPGWSPLQLQVANLLARAPQAHMASERGVTWHTPTPPPHLYHVPAPSPPDPLQALSQLQAMKSASNSVFRHTATPPELYRHTPTPPEKHMLRHTPSPGDVKTGASLPPTDLYPHLGTGRADKLVRAEELLAYARGGVDLTLGGPRGANGSPAAPPAPAAAPAAAPPALSVRDAPTINSLIARAAPHARPAHARVDALLERLAAAPAPASPHSVIVHSRAAPTPSPPSSNEDSADSCGAPPGSKRKRKPERTIRVPAPPPPAVAPSPPPLPPPREPPPLENGDAPHAAANGPPRPPSPRSPPAPEPHARRKTRANSAETIDDIAAMIASREPVAEPPPAPEPDVPVTVDMLESVLASPQPAPAPDSPGKSPPPELETPRPEAKSPPKPDANPEPGPPPPVAAAAPRRRSARTSTAESANVPVESPSEAKPAETEAAEARSAEPTAASFVEVENQLEKMFAGLEEEPAEGTADDVDSTKKKAAKPRNRRKSVPSKDPPKKPAKRARRALTMAVDEPPPRQKTPPRKKSPPRRKGLKKKGSEKIKKPKESVKDAYDSGSNASSSKSRGPYVQIVGPRASPVSVCVVNAGAEEERRGEEWRGRNGLRARGLHASTLGLRYDATTPDVTWLCAFCDAGPHHQGRGDLFGPYVADIDCDEYRALDEASRRRFDVRTAGGGGGGAEVWFHEACGVWAPGVLAAGARLWGLAPAVWAARAARCAHCSKQGASVSCAARACRARVHLPCAERARWALHRDYRALCPRHA
ncbi:uncharacterized protein [Epargyreus clarus]|uniref:uncharacterized protein n=1 Tax=Epargyreus clarus TaxID=520877 RepID=UPI003C2E31FE